MSLIYVKGFTGVSDGKESACSAGDLVQSLGWEDPLDKEMEPTPVFLLENPQDSGAWQAIVCRVIKSQTRVSDFTFFLLYMYMIGKIFIFLKNRI